MTRRRRKPPTLPDSPAPDEGEEAAPISRRLNFLQARARLRARGVRISHHPKETKT